jgi:hypothetical protein
MWDLSAKPTGKRKGETSKSPLAFIYEWPLQDSNLQPKDYESFEGVASYRIYPVSF